MRPKEKGIAAKSFFAVAVAYTVVRVTYYTSRQYRMGHYSMN